MLKQKTGGKEQAVAWEKEADEQAGLGINHEQNCKYTEAGN